jgi:hypothetical protein
MPTTRNGKGRLECCEDIQELVSSVLNIRGFLTLEEESRIHRQFRNCSWIPDHQVLWSGMLREQAQSWADERGMQTLTTAMGPLMDPRVSSCPKNGKSGKAWSRYVHGASAVFAWHIAMEDVVAVLCPPPPQRFHPSGLSYYQTIEEPILRAAIADGASLRIKLVHLQVNGAEDFWYDMWPVDEVETWIEAFGATTCHKCVWRMVKGHSPPPAARKAAQAQLTPAKATSKATENIDNVTLPRAGCQPVSAKKSKKKKKKKKSQKTSSRCETPISISGKSSLATQSKSTPRNASSPLGQKKIGPAAKTAVPLEETVSSNKAAKKAKKKAQRAAMKQGQKSKSRQGQGDATSKGAQSTKGMTNAPKLAKGPDKIGSKPKTRTSQKRPSEEERQALRAAVAEYGNQLASSTSVVQSKNTQRQSGQSKQDVLQRDVVYETWLEY